MGKYFESSIQDDEDVIEEFKFPEYTNQELWALNTELDEKYNGGKGLEDINNWLIDNEAINKFGAIKVSGYKLKYNKKHGHYSPRCDEPTKYRLLMDKLEKASKLLGRKEYAERKQVEEILKMSEEIAQEMVVDTAVLPDGEIVEEERIKAVEEYKQQDEKN